MSRKRKKNEIETLFREKFNITFSYRPTMANTEDTFYYLILDDMVKIRVKLFGNILVIDEVVPLTMKYMANIFKDMVELLINQDKFTVLISILGNTNAIREFCIQGVLVEDIRFITVPTEYYNRMVDYYKGDKSKYGFYILSVVEEEEPIAEESPKKEVKNLADLDLPDEEVDMGPPIKIGVKPLLDRFVEHLETAYKVTEDGIRNNVLANLCINGIHFQAKTNFEENELRVGRFVYDDDYRHTDMVKIVVKICDFIDDCPDVYIESNDSESNNVCEFLSLSPQTTKLGSRVLYDTIGIYKANRIQ